MQQRNHDVVYGYFTVHTQDGQGYICVRLDRPPLGSTSNKYKASFSACSPLDAPTFHNAFSKQFRALSRKIANDRMECKRAKYYVEFAFDKIETTKLPDIFRAALEAGLRATKPDRDDKFLLPDWVRSNRYEYGLVKPPSPYPKFGEVNKRERLVVSV